MYHVIHQQFIKLLSQVNGYLDKLEQDAQRRKYDPGVMLQTRLTPDQYPFIKQVQVACDTAKGTAARLSGKNAPVHEDNETTVAQLRARVQKCVEHLKTYSAQDFNGWEEKPVEIFFMPGKFLNGGQYVYDLALPNFFFHLTTAYSVLRANGVDIGKMDYIGELKTYEKK